MRGLRSIGVLLSVLLFLCIGAVLAVFLIRNDHWVVIRFPGLGLDVTEPFTITEWEAPLYVVILSSTLIGGLLATLIYLPLWLRRSVRLNRDRRFIDALEEELTDLRNLPVNAPAPLEDIVEDDEPERGTRKLSGEDEEALLLSVLQDPEPEARR